MTEDLLPANSSLNSEESTIVDELTQFLISKGWKDLPPIEMGEDGFLRVDFTNVFLARYGFSDVDEDLEEILARVLKAGIHFYIGPLDASDSHMVSELTYEGGLVHVTMDCWVSVDDMVSNITDDEGVIGRFEDDEDMLSSQEDVPPTLASIKESWERQTRVIEEQLEVLEQRLEEEVRLLEGQEESEEQEDSEDDDEEID